MGLSLFKLEKLKITAFTKPERSILNQKGLPFEAMFNPTSYSRSYAIVWGKKQGVNASGAQLDYARTPPSELKFNLILDGTGVDTIGLFSFFSPSVLDRVTKFLDITYEYNGTMHEPNYLLVEWGSLTERCRLSKVDIKYTLFDRDGTPLRAELDITLITDAEATRRSKIENKSSPDLTHARVVRRGDTLPLLTKQIYGTADCYLDVARFNNLDDFRSLKPGQQLLFPPLATFAPTDSGSGAADKPGNGG